MIFTSVIRSVAIIVTIGCFVAVAAQQATGKSSSTAKLSTTTTTIKPPTTTKPSTTTKAHTTTKPRTTTTLSTTTKSSTTAQTTTTAKHSTTTGHPTSTTVKPATGAQNYTAAFNNGTVCMKISAKITVTASVFVPAANKSKTLTMAVPTGLGVSDSSCGSSQDEITLSWRNYTNMADITITFTAKKESESKYSLNIKLEVEDEKKNDSWTFKSKFGTSVGNAYQCMKTSITTLKQESTTLHVDDLRYKAFMQKKDDVFKKHVEDCDNATDKIVPIVVGCALAAMVLIVLIGYCIGRRRTRPGYQQMNA